MKQTTLQNKGTYKGHKGNTKKTNKGNQLRETTKETNK